MTQAKHTPGPWVLTEGDRFEKEMVITTQDRLDNSIGCICEMDVDFSGQIGIEQEANARLIAAAPDLKNVVDSFQISGPDGDGFIWLVLHGNGATGKAMFNLGTEGGIAATVALLLEKERRAAIAKATGA